VVAPLTFERIVVFEDTFGNPLNSYGTCVQGSTIQTVFLVVGFLLHTLLLIACWLAANSVQNAPTDFHEGKYISYAMSSMTQVYLIGVPASIAVYSSPVGRYLVITSLVFATVMLVLFCAVFPKWYKFTFGKNFYEFEGTTLEHHGRAGEREALKSKPDGQTTTEQQQLQASAVDSGDLRSPMQAQTATSL
jgi:hypothetical protein